MIRNNYIGAAGSKIGGVGYYLPEQILPNDALSEAFGIETDDVWIRKRTGIEERHIAGDDETVANMAALAARNALENSGAAADEIDLVVLATLSAEDRCPNVASRVAKELGIKNAATFDLNAACAGFCHALANVDHAIRAGTAGKALVVGSEKMLSMVDKSDRATSVLFGDGAGAVVISRAENAEEVGVGPVVWGGVPELGDALRIGSNWPLEQDGQAVFRWATSLAPVARRVVEASGIEVADLGAVVLHQANKRIIDTLIKKLGVSPDAFVSCDVVRSGNTSAASIPIALSKMVLAREVQPGTPTLLFGFGGGLTYAGQVVKTP